MTELANMIPQSVISLIGLAVLLGVLIMLGTFFQEWAKSIYRRKNNIGSETNLEEAIARVFETLQATNREIQEFVVMLKTAHVKTTEDIQQSNEVLEEIKRKQDKNWRRLFEEELKNTFCRAK